MPSLQNQLDYIFFVYGFAFVLLGFMAWNRPESRGAGRTWRWLGGFGLLHGTHEWLQMVALSLRTAVLDALILGLLIASFLSLVEFGRRYWSNHGRHVRAWIHLPLVGLTALGLFAGQPGLDIACRYSLGFPGALLAATVFWDMSRKARPGRCWPWLAGSAACALYAVCTGLIVRKGSIPTTAWLNQDLFLAWTGVPVQVIRAACGIAGASVLWWESQRQISVMRRSWLRRLRVPSGIALLLVVGWLATESRGRAADADLRETVLRRATAVARAIDYQDVHELDFSPEDEAKPAFQRLRQQLIEYGKAISQRSIYTMAIRNGAIHFGPENIAEDDPLASTPGQRYERPTPKDWQVFRDAKAYTQGPYTDEYGTFISGSAPVTSRQTGEVILVVGADMLADDWRHQIARQRLPFILLTLLLSTILLAGRAALNRRARQRAGDRRWYHQIEAILTATSGAVLTVIVAMLAHDAETRAQRQIFSTLADGQAKCVHDAMDRIDTQLFGLSRFIQECENLDWHSFHAYTDPLLGSAAVQAFEWIPAVRSEKHEQFEEAFRAEGHGEMRVHAYQGKEPVHGLVFPVCYVSPPAGNEAAIGLDLESEPLRRAAMNLALQSGYSTATEPIQLVQDAEHQPGLLICQPVYEPAPESGLHSASNRGRPVRGFAVAVLRMKSLLRGALIHSSMDVPMTDVSLYWLGADHEPRRLARISESPEAASAQPPSWAQAHGAGLSLSYPLFAFGKAQAVMLQPSKAFCIAHPRRAGLSSMLAGLFLTACVTTVVWVLGNRRASLEKEVAIRTAALRRSEEAHRRQFVDNTAAMLLVDPAEGHILDGNATATRFYGYPAERLRKMSLYDLDASATDESTSDLAAMLLSHGSQVESRHKLADGSQRDVEIYASLIQLGPRRVIHAIVHDITERKRAERELADYQARLEQQVEERTQSLLHAEVMLHQQEKLASVGQLAAGVAHEINTPMQYVGDNLRAIQDAFTDVLELERQYHELVDLVKQGVNADDKIRTIEEAERTFDLDFIVEEMPKAISQGLEGVDRVSSIVRAMKHFSHVGGPAPAEVDINHSLQSTLTVARNEYKYVADVETDFGELPSVECYGAEMNQVFLNLVVNAAHAIAETKQHGKITVRTRQLGDHVEIAISDTGAGIREDIRRKVFDPFFTTKEVGKGTGQGLYLAQQIVVGRHQGQLTFETEVGKGTTFFIRIPIFAARPAGTPTA